MENDHSQTKWPGFRQEAPPVWMPFLTLGGCLSSCASAVIAAFLYFKLLVFLMPIASQRLQVPAAIAAIFLIAAIASWRREGDIHAIRVIDISSHDPIPAIHRRFIVGANLFWAGFPIALALYQLTRVPLLPVLGVSTISTLLFYLSVRVIPGWGRHLLWPAQLWLMALVLVLSGDVLLPSSSIYFNGAVTFAGGIFGCCIGADLLHLKDVEKGGEPIKNPSFLGFGNVGFADGILNIGGFSLFTAEWFPKTVDFVEARSAWPIGHDPLVLLVLAGALVMLYGINRRYGTICNQLDSAVRAQMGTIHL